jgi:hypothetical protein
MFETVHLNARTEADGHLRLDVPLDLPAESEVTVTVRVRPEFDRAEWEAHLNRVVGSIPDIEAPERSLPREIDPL